MAIQTINIGQIANDGTGDDLRVAFDKVNDNFEELDLRFPEEATGANLGALGQGVFAEANNSRLTFKRIIGGTNISLSATNEAITIDGPQSLDQLLTITDSGSVTVQTGQTLGINGGVGITTRADGQTIVIDAGAGVLGADTSPVLNAALDANGQNIASAGTVTATQFNGPLEGLVYGVDIRTIAGFYDDFDFGAFRPSYTAIIQWLQGEVDVDFGTFVAPGLVFGEVDLGSFV